MRIKKLFYLAAFLTVVGLNFSCEQDSTAETDALYGIDKDEITDGDT